MPKGDRIDRKERDEIAKVIMQHDPYSAMPRSKNVEDISATGGDPSHMAQPQPRTWEDVHREMGYQPSKLGRELGVDDLEEMIRKARR
jgi:hypothetical protein